MWCAQRTSINSTTGHITMAPKEVYQSSWMRPRTAAGRPDATEKQRIDNMNEDSPNPDKTKTSGIHVAVLVTGGRCRWRWERWGCDKLELWHVIQVHERVMWWRCGTHLRILSRPPANSLQLHATPARRRGCQAGAVAPHAPAWQWGGRAPAQQAKERRNTRYGAALWYSQGPSVCCLQHVPHSLRLQRKA